jgi:hypothetical protein
LAVGFAFHASGESPDARLDDGFSADGAGDRFLIADCVLLPMYEKFHARQWKIQWWPVTDNPVL